MKYVKFTKPELRLRFKLPSIIKLVCVVCTTAFLTVLLLIRVEQWIPPTGPSYPFYRGINCNQGNTKMKEILGRSKTNTKPVPTVDTKLYSVINERLAFLKRLFPHHAMALIDDHLSENPLKRTLLNTFSFKNTKQNDISEYLNILPKNRTCAVIGNSGILLDSSCGAEIDSHDFVLRSNIAPIKGFENDVGSRKDFSSLNSEFSRTSAACLQNEQDPCYERTLDRFSVYNKSIIWLSKLGGYKSLKAYGKIVSLLNKHKIQPVIAYPSKSIRPCIESFWKISSPSSGLYLYTFAASLCEKITLYGFYPFYQSPNGTLLKHHYYEKTTFNYVKHHNMPEEFQLFKLLHDFGFVRLVTGECNTPI